MAAINFVKGEQYYTAEFQINGPVNVHIERAEAGALYFRQRSIDHGSYDLINGANWNNRGDLTIDTAIQGVVYPMWIKIESTSEPTLAEMVEGEQSGGGAGTESTMEYLDVSDWDKTDMLNKALLSTAQLFRLNANGTVAVATNDSGAINYCEAVGVDFSLELISNGKIMTLGEGWAQSLTEEELAAIPRITKEEFYNLEA